MIGITNGLGTIYSADKDVTECIYQFPLELIEVGDVEIIELEDCGG